MNGKKSRIESNGNNDQAEYASKQVFQPEALSVDVSFTMMENTAERAYRCY